MNNELVNGRRRVGVLYGFDGADAVLPAIGVTAADAYKSENGKNYYTSDVLNGKLAAALAANATTVKNALEAAVKNGHGHDRDGRCRSHLCGKPWAGPVPRCRNQSTGECHLYLQPFLRVLTHDHRGRHRLEL